MPEVVASLRPEMSRSFVAVWPPGDVVDAIAAMPRPDLPGVRWLPARTWHVTLRFLGGADPADVAASLAAARFPPATAAVGTCVRRLGRDALVLDVSGLDALAAAVHEATAGLGPPAEHRFRGHLTVARVRREPRDVERTLADTVRLATPVAFTVTDVALVASRTLPSGAEYTTIGRWPTGG
jgi:2'-5' RNA ligase